MKSLVCHEPNFYRAAKGFLQDPNGLKIRLLNLYPTDVAKLIVSEMTPGDRVPQIQTLKALKALA